MKNLKNKFKNMKGITLISLVVTIIILLILAGITINTLMNNGLFEKAKEAKDKWQNAQDDEETQIAKYTNDINSYVGGVRNLTSKKVLYNNGKITSNGDYNLTDSITNYDLFIVETKNSADGDRKTSTTFYIDDEIFNSSGFQVNGFSNRDTQFKFIENTNKFNVFAVENEYIYRIIGIKL